MKAYALVLALVGLVTGCSSSGGAVIVEIRSDLAVPDELDRLSILVTTDGPWSLSRDLLLGEGAGRVTLPARLSLEGQGSAQNLTIAATGYRSGSAVVSSTVVSKLETTSVQTVVVSLLRVCVGVACPSGLVCQPWRVGCGAPDEMPSATERMGTWIDWSSSTVAADSPWPSPRGDPAAPYNPAGEPGLAYDPQERTVFLYGGGGRDDLWSWDGRRARWTLLNAGTPPQPVGVGLLRLVDSIAYDDVSDRLRRIRWSIPGNGAVRVWAVEVSDWDGQSRTWLSQPESPASGAPPIGSSTPAIGLGVLDVARQRIVLAAESQTTWEWDLRGAGWVDRKAAPPGGIWSVAAPGGALWDAERARVHFLDLAGATGLPGSVWSWDGALARWSSAAPRTGLPTPPPLASGYTSFHAAVDRGRKGIVVPGPAGLWRWSFERSTWELQRYPEGRPAPLPGPLVHDDGRGRLVMWSDDKVWEWVEGP